ncbi:hypothetical protein R3I94_020530 [Phoxinus phoxinus]|uniref:Distal membrane-arm assembly complex protein 1-like domain-containing protein n=1 Tax=Phoxinus phoxinus TaxID=58324 RepID=A0AAN9GUK8_9TELE
MSSPTPLPEKSSPVTKPVSENCWSCRILSGGGLLVSGGYVFMQAQKFKHLGGPPSMGTVAQIVFAAGLASWGIVLIADPVGKKTRKQ